MNRVRPTASSESSTSALRSLLLSFLCRSGRSTLFRTDDHGINERPYSWKTGAIASGGDVTRLPRRTTSPRVGRSRPATHFSSVVLPQPDGPTTQTNSPSSTTNETSCTASVALAPVPYVLASPLISSTATPERRRASRDATRAGAAPP